LNTFCNHGDYPQIEDGIGMVRSFYEDFRRLWRRLEHEPPRNPQRLHGTILTGQLFAPVLTDLLQRVKAVENLYFGSETVVAGLMTGTDILAMRDQIEGDFVIIPSTAHKSDEPIMLDGVQLTELARQLNFPIHALDFDGFAHLIYLIICLLSWHFQEIVFKSKNSDIIHIIVENMLCNS
jgi:NifB/MoaA-like Fe-S oxidoreductase